MEKPEEWLTRSGRPYKAVGGELVMDCPSCGKARHLYVSRLSGAWHCKKCDARGGNHQLQKLLGLVLDKIEHLGAPDRHDLSEVERREKEAKFARFKSMSDCERWNRDLLLEPAAQTAREYLTARGITQHTIRKQGLGWMPEPPRGSGPTGATNATKVVPKPPHPRFANHPKYRQPTPDAEPEPVAEPVRATGPGWLAIPAFVERDGDGSPAWASVGMVKMRSVPPAERAFQRLAGGRSVLWKPGPLDPDKPLMIVGGELDAISVWQAGFSNVISTTLGETSWSEDWTQELAEFADIVIAYDDDDAGKAGAKLVSERLGKHRCRIAEGWRSFDGLRTKDCKDANAVLVELGDDFDIFGIEAWLRRARMLGGDGLHRVGTLKERYLERMANPEAIKGRRTPWVGLTKVIGGTRPGDVIVITGSEGTGKSTLATQWALFEASTLRVPTLVIPLELGVMQQLDKMTRQALRMAPLEAGPERVAKQFDVFLGWPLWVLEHYGSIDVEVLRNTLVFAIQRLGIRQVLLDHLHFAAAKDDKNRQTLERMMSMLAELATKYQMTFLVVAHPTKLDSKGAKGGERDNQIVQNNDIGGSAAIKQDASVILSLWRERTADRTTRAKLQPGHFPAVVVVGKGRGDEAGEGKVALVFEKSAALFHDDSNLFLTTKESD